MTTFCTFNPKTVISSIGFRKTAEIVPYQTGSIYTISDGLFAAYVTVKPDEKCPHGLFSTAAAVDCEENRAMERASFEAAERYCLASQGWHTARLHQVTQYDQIWQLPFTMTEPFCSSKEGAEFLLSTPLNKLGGKHWSINCGDVFAPYPILTHHCQFVPSTNGVAFANNMSTAITHAVLESLERDSIMRFWYSKEYQKSRAVNIDDLLRLEPVIMKFLNSLGYEVIAFEISRYNCVHIFLVFAKQNDGVYPFSACAAGTGFSNDMALSAALLELIQTILALSTQGQQYMAWHKNGSQILSLDHHMFYYASSNFANLPIQHLCTIWNNIEPYNFLSQKVGNFQDLIEEFTEDGVEIDVVDLTPPPISMEAACVRVLSKQFWPLIVSEKHGPLEIVNHPDRLPYQHPFP